MQRSVVPERRIRDNAATKKLKCPGTLDPRKIAQSVIPKFIHDRAERSEHRHRSIRESADIGPVELHGGGIRDARDDVLAAQDMVRKPRKHPRIEPDRADVVVRHDIDEAAFDLVIGGSGYGEISPVNGQAE